MQSGTNRDQHDSASTIRSKQGRDPDPQGASSGKMAAPSSPQLPDRLSFTEPCAAGRRPGRVGSTVPIPPGYRDHVRCRAPALRRRSGGAPQAQIRRWCERGSRRNTAVRKRAAAFCQREAARKPRFGKADCQSAHMISALWNGASLSAPDSDHEDAPQGDSCRRRSAPPCGRPLQLASPNGRVTGKNVAFWSQRCRVERLRVSGRVQDDCRKGTFPAALKICGARATPWIIPQQPSQCNRSAPICRHISKSILIRQIKNVGNQLMLALSSRRRLAVFEERFNGR